jgi:hypothetical protein
MNIVYAYVVFLLGRKVYGVELARLRVLIARWLFMAQLTARYTGSSESQIQKDLDRIEAVVPGDPAGFERVLDEIISGQLTPDFWRYNMPQQLITSGPALSPHYQCYLAALNILDARMFMLDMRVHEWMDPSLPAVKGVEGHHLFPRDYQTSVLGITDVKRINQAANFAPTDWSTNIRISNRAPSEYWPELVAERGQDPAWLAKQMYWHALPPDWEQMEYEEFLAARRVLMAEVTRDAYQALVSGHAARVEPYVTVGEPTTEPTLADLVERELLRPGDLLDPVDPDRVVDAVVGPDGTIIIDGVYEFDSLDEATRHLGVTNISGLEFWALEDASGELLPLIEMAMPEESG